jgi:MFS family permease
VFPAHSSAAQLVLASVVGQDEVRLTRANGIMGSLNEAGSLMGPALGGALIALTNASDVLLIDAATYAVAVALAVAVVRPGRVVAVEGEAGDAGHLLAGFRVLVTDRWLRSVSAGVCVMELSWTGMMAALPVLALRGFDRNVFLAGWFIGAFGGGSMIGGLLSARVIRRFGIGRVAIGAYAVEAAAMWALATSPPAGGVIGAVAVDGFCMGIFMPALFAEMTLRTPIALRAKTLAAANVAFSAGGPIGFIGVGFLLQRVTSTAPAFLAIAAAATVAAIVAAAAPPATRPAIGP